jgi:NADH:ubiquinone oxidoreductase subunit 3 (subunit A)
LGWQVFGLMLAFVLLVEVGHLYAYKKGVFDWNKRG